MGERGEGEGRVKGQQRPRLHFNHRVVLPSLGRGRHHREREREGGHGGGEGRGGEGEGEGGRRPPGAIDPPSGITSQSAAAVYTAPSHGSSYGDTQLTGRLYPTVMLHLPVVSAPAGDGEEQQWRRRTK